MIDGWIGLDWIGLDWLVPSNSWIVNLTNFKCQGCNTPEPTLLYYRIGIMLTRTQALERSRCLY